MEYVSDDGRSGALLTPTQRDWIHRDLDIEPGDARDRAMRARAQERLANSILDFSLVYEGLSREERLNAYERYIGGSVGADRAWQDAIAAGVSILYEASKDSAREFDWYLNNGIEAVDGPVKVTFDVEPVPEAEGVVADARGKLKRGEWDDLTDEEKSMFLWWYSRSAEFDPDVPVREQQAYRESRGDETTEV